MRIRPRQQLLDVWRATVRLSHDGGSWVWGGGAESNSISDAEQLLCLLMPGTSLDAFRLDRMDMVPADVVDALSGLGGLVNIQRVLLQAMTEYFTRYSGYEGEPVFPGAERFSTGGPEVTQEQRELQIVDSFAVAVTVSLAALSFLRGLRPQVSRADVRADVDRLEDLANVRLTGAMVGLLRSFTVNIFDADSDSGLTLLRTINQDLRPGRVVVNELWRALQEPRAALRELSIGVDTTPLQALDDPQLLFECGWSWGVVEDTPEVETPTYVAQPRGCAEPAPYLYFSVTALDAIAELFAERVRIQGLLNDEQQRLARALQLRWDITQRYWATVATFNETHWPLEDIPWRTTDGEQSDYFSLLVTAIAVQDLATRRAPDSELRRLCRVLDELAKRAKITRQSYPGDPALILHQPGTVITLGGSEKLGPRLRWTCADFAPQLLKRTVDLAGLTLDAELRSDLLVQADLVWDHLLRRAFAFGPARNLWDQARGAFPMLEEVPSVPSWYVTKRVLDCVVAAARVASEPTPGSDRIVDFARELINEAEQLLDQELLRGSDQGPALRTRLREASLMLARAKSVLNRRPGTAVVQASEVLRMLDLLEAARDESAG